MSAETLKTYLVEGIGISDEEAQALTDLAMSLVETKNLGKGTRAVGTYIAMAAVGPSFSMIEKTNVYLIKKIVSNQQISEPYKQAALHAIMSEAGRTGYQGW